MKTMTCRQIGGPCDHVITGNTPEEMIKNGMRHLHEEHPQMEKDMKAMSKSDTDKWNADFMKKWEATPEMKA